MNIQLAEKEGRSGGRGLFPMAPAVAWTAGPEQQSRGEGAGSAPAPHAARPPWGEEACFWLPRPLPFSCYFKFSKYNIRLLFLNTSSINK